MIIKHIYKMKISRWKITLYIYILFFVHLNPVHQPLFKSHNKKSIRNDLFNERTSHVRLRISRQEIYGIFHLFIKDLVFCFLGWFFHICHHFVLIIISNIYRYLRSLDPANSHFRYLQSAKYGISKTKLFIFIREDGQLEMG